MKRFLMAVLALCLLLTCGAAAGAEGEPVYLAGNAQLSEFAFSGEELDFMMNEPDFFGETWYSKGDLPEGVEWKDPDLGGTIVGLHQKDETGGTYEDVKPDKFALEFISGTPELAKAVSLWEAGDGTVLLQMNPEELTVSGSAVFRITLENEKYFYRQEKTLTVESFRDNPPFVVSDVPLTGRMRTNSDASSEGIFSFYLSKAKISGDTGKAGFNVEDPSRFLDNVPGFTGSGGGMYQIAEAGIYDFRLPVTYSNVEFELNCRMTLSEDYIRGEGSAAPGESLPFTVTSSRGVDYTWGVTGEGASISKEGLLTVDEDTPVNTLLLVTATPEDGGITISQNVLVEEFGFASATVEKTISSGGIRAPVLGGRSWEVSAGQGNPVYTSRAVSGTGLINIAYVYFFRVDQFVYDDATAEAYFQNNRPGDAEYEIREIRIDGIPAALYTFRVKGDGTDLTCGLIDYVRNNCELVLNLISGRQGTLEDGDFRITLDYLEEVASHIHYDASKASVTYDDVRLTVEPDKNAAPVVVAGKKLQMKASFGNPDKVNKKNKNDEILWSITDAEGGETTAATVTNKGQVTAAKNLEAPVTVNVTATSGFFGIKETRQLTLIPAAAKIETDPAEINLYEGSDKTETVRAILTPDTVPLDVVEWKLAKEGFAEMTAAGDGAVSFKALKAGKTTATASEPGGKKATVKVNVFLPVEDVDLQVTGKQVPGGTVTVKATIAPKNAGKKDLEWSLDVGEDIATVNNKGQVKIAKTAPAGTVVTVTCKALGAPEPVVKTVSFEIADK